MLNKFNFFLITALVIFSTVFHASVSSFNDKNAQTSVLIPSGHDSNVHLKDFTRANLDSLRLYPWFKYAYHDYNPDGNKIDSLSLLKDHISIIVFGGSWCGDTKDLLPKFYKTVEKAKIPADKITLIGVDRHKHSHDGRAGNTGSGAYQHSFCSMTGRK